MLQNCKKLFVGVKQVLLVLVERESHELNDNKAKPASEKCRIKNVTINKVLTENSYELFGINKFVTTFTN